MSKKTSDGPKTDGHWDVPVDRSGNMTSYPQGWTEETGEIQKRTICRGGADIEIDWPVRRQVEAPFVPFPPRQMRMRVIDVERGRSAARFTLQDVATGKTYPMFMVDILDMIKDIEFNGVWASQKRGQNYGIARIQP